MPWPDKVIRQFQAIPQNPVESDFQGAYNKLLYTLFPHDTDFTVVPQYLQPTWKSTYYIVAFEILYENKPVFILQLRKPAGLQFLSSREEADTQIRERLGDLAGESFISTLHGVSATVGTQLCFYHLDTTDVEADVVPLNIPRHPGRVIDTAPMERWDCDVLDVLVGEVRLRAVVDSIKAACANVAHT